MPTPSAHIASGIAAELSRLLMLRDLKTKDAARLCGLRACELKRVLQGDPTVSLDIVHKLLSGMRLNATFIPYSMNGVTGMVSAVEPSKDKAFDEKAVDNGEEDV